MRQEDEPTKLTHLSNLKVYLINDCNIGKVFYKTKK